MTSSEIKRLRASEQKYRHMIERANDAILTVDPTDGRIIGGNPKAMELTGFSCEELGTMHVWDLHPPEEIDTTQALFERVKRDGGAEAEDVHFLRKDGRRVDIEITASVIAVGEIRVIQRICRDVTERKKRERELAHHRAFIELVLSISADFNRLRGQEILAAIDQALAQIGRFARVDRSYLYLLEKDGMSRPCVWSTDPSTVKRWLPKDGRVPLTKFEWGLDVLKKGEAIEFETEENPAILGESGPAYTRRSLMLPMSSGDKLDGFIGFDVLRTPRVWDDQTKELLRMVGYIFGSALGRKRAEEALLKANEDLESKVEARTKDLREKQAQLVQTEKMASLGQLVAGVAHELNTPLGALKSTVQTVDGVVDRMRSLVDAEPIDVRRLKRTIDALASGRNAGRAAIERIDRIVRSLRSFARLDRAHIDRIDLVEGIESALALTQHKLKERIEIQRQLEPLPAVECHPAQVNQVFMNVLLNAIWAIEEHGVITLKSLAQNGEVMVEIADTGRGIEQENLPRIFDPGFTTKGVGVGTGLGLSIAHQIVREHSGRIEVESQVGEGTSFKIWLPVVHRHVVLAD